MSRSDRGVCYVNALKGIENNRVGYFVNQYPAITHFFIHHVGPHNEALGLATSC